MVFDGASSSKVYIGHQGVVGSTLALLSNKTSSNYLFAFLKNNYSFLSQNNIGSAILHANKKVISELEMPVIDEHEKDLFDLLLLRKIHISHEIVLLKKEKELLLKKYF